MKLRLFQISTILCLLAFGVCTMPEVIKPLNLYDTGTGNTIALYFRPTTQGHGTLSTGAGADQKYHGECNFSQERGFPRPGGFAETRSSDTSRIRSFQGFAEAYGFTKDSPAKPVGSGI